jgi:DNA adenine methylase
MVTNPVLKYYGAKFRLAKWIIEHFPRHKSYVEPFGGGGAVLFQKQPSDLETYNDLDGDVVNFFEILRERSAELIRAVRLTPWARNEYERCLTNCEDKLENARRLFVRLWMSKLSGTLTTKGMWRRNLDPSDKSPAKVFFRDTLFQASERLKFVQIENRDALKLIEDFDRGEETLFYLDPPYVPETRVDPKRYACEIDEEKHRELADVLHKVESNVVISGYDCKLYKELFEDKGWHKVDKRAIVNGGAERTESLWLSPQTFEIWRKQMLCKE